MQTKTLTDQLAVSPQLSEADIAALASQGIHGIINNRPDGEADDQPTSAALESAASRAGIAYRYLPIIPQQIDATQVTAFAQALAEMPGPILAFCRSGTRSAGLWALAIARQGKPVAEILAQTGQAGYDLAALRPRLAQATPR